MSNLELSALILGTLADAGERGAPSGHIYAAIMQHVSLSDYQIAVGALQQGGCLTSEFHLLKATGKGMKIGREVNRLLAERKSA